MKKLLILLLFIPVFAFSQDSTKFEFGLVDSVHATKSELYTYAKSWMAKTFVSSKDVIEMDDKDAGRIIGKGYFIKRENSAFGNQVGLSLIQFTIQIDTKDNKYRCQFMNFKHSYVQTASTYNPNESFSMNKLTSAIASNRSGGSLENEKPACGGMSMTKKQWNKIKEYARTDALSAIQSFKKAMAEGKLNSDF